MFTEETLSVYLVPMDGKMFKQIFSFLLAGMACGTLRKVRTFYMDTLDAWG
jgi:hypothetical protein